MPAYLVTLDRTKSGHTLAHGADAMVVFAASATAAKQAAAAKFDGDGLAWTGTNRAPSLSWAIRPTTPWTKSPRPSCPR
jgi:hypothetical protein